MSQVDHVEQTATPRGLGGWLILPIIGLFTTPFLGVLNLGQVLPNLQNLSYFNGLQGGFIVVETIVNGALQLIAPIALLVLLFGKRRQFPRLYKLFLGFNLAWVVFDLRAAYVLIQQLYASGQVAFWDRETIRSLVQAAVGTAIWIPYMSVSVRVRNTFVN